MSLMLFVLAFQASAVPVTAPAVAPVAVAPVKPAKPKLICEVVERMGSRIQADQVCITKEQWLQRRQDDREQLDRTKINSPSTSG